MATPPPQRKRPMVQKIVIPSGLVRPNETVVIEVPSNLKKHAVVIATRPKARTKDQATDGTGDEGLRPNPCTINEEDVSQYYDQDYSQVEDSGDAEDTDLMNQVDEAERAEREMLFRNLMAFHRARRNVLVGTKNILSQSFTGSNLIQSQSQNQRMEGYPSEDNETFESGIEDANDLYMTGLDESIIRKPAPNCNTQCGVMEQAMIPNYRPHHINTANLSPQQGYQSGNYRNIPRNYYR